MKWFLNMKVAAKLLTGFIIVALIAGVIGVVGIISMSSMKENDKTLYENMTAPMQQINDIAVNFQMARVYSRDMIMADNMQDVNQYYDQIVACSNNITKDGEIFQTKIITDEQQALFDELQAKRNEYKEHLKELKDLCLANNDISAEELLHGDMAKTCEAEQTAVDNLVQYMVDTAQEKSNENSKTADTATLLLILIAAIGAVISVTLGLMISRVIGNPIKKLLKGVELISDGDLNANIDIDTKDELGILAKSFNKMTDNLNEVMSNINESSEQVASGSKQVSESSMALSQGATEQASSIEELTASIEEISSQTKLNSENANKANGLADEAKSNAEHGNSQMKEMLKAMDEINESSNNISKIIKVIDEIAFQTNILALNAAVEAARAGQHGKGFAVVAEEVRNLAARSANAAKETTEMIEGSVKKVDYGTKIANQTADALNSIVNDISKVSSLVGNIAVASNEQATGIEQVNQGIMQVSAVVQTNSATSEEGASASEELSGQAELLKQQVLRFKLKRNGYSTVKKGYENFEPEVLKVINNYNQNVKQDDSSADKAKSIEMKPSRKIELSDLEFGKY